MQLSSAPTKIAVPFADTGGKNTIPVTTGTPGAASYEIGFPPVTMQSVSSGGIPPSGLDFNGIFNNGSSVIERWVSAGAGFQFDSGFATTVGGYPKGARVLNAAGDGYWLSIIDNNENDPDTGGAGWIPDGRTAIASVYAAAAQTLAMGFSKVIWDSVDYDSVGLWDAGNHRFKALWAGKYRLSGAVYLPAAAGQNLGTAIYKNGALAKLTFQYPQVTDEALTLPFDSQISCAANDYLETFVNVEQTAVSAGAASGSSEPYVFGQLEYLGA